MAEWRLFLETSTARASLVLADGWEVVEREEFTSDRSHNSALFGPLERVLGRLGGERLGLVVVGTGPGSYSGTRVGIAAGQGVALVHGCEAVGVPSYWALGSAAAGVMVVGDAKRGSGWGVELGVEDEGEPALVGVEELEAEVAERLARGGEVLTIEGVGGMGWDPVLVGRVRVEAPQARELMRAWMGWDDEERRRLAARPLQPVYLRPPHITEAKAGHPLKRG